MKPQRYGGHPISAVKAKMRNGETVYKPLQWQQLFFVCWDYFIIISLAAEGEPATDDNFFQERSHLQTNQNCLKLIRIAQELVGRSLDKRTTKDQHCKALFQCDQIGRFLYYFLGKLVTNWARFLEIFRCQLGHWDLNMEHFLTKLSGHTALFLSFFLSLSLLHFYSVSLFTHLF